MNALDELELKGKRGVCTALDYAVLALSVNDIADARRAAAELAALEARNRELEAELWQSAIHHHATKQHPGEFTECAYAACRRSARALLKGGAK